MHHREKERLRAQGRWDLDAGAARRAKRRAPWAGGAVEHQVTLDAQALWRDGAGPLRKHYDLSHAAAELGMVCGGKIDVEFEVRR